MNLESTGLPSLSMFLDPETLYTDTLGITDLFSPKEGDLPNVFNQSLARAVGSSNQETGSSSGT